MLYPSRLSGLYLGKKIIAGGGGIYLYISALNIFYIYAQIGHLKDVA